MKNTLVTIAAMMIMAACSEAPVTTPEATPSLDKKSGGQTTTYTVVNVAPTNWNITSDTSACGTLILRWTDQGRQAGASNYTFDVTPKTPNCAGGLNSATNILYYTYGWGCSFWPMQTYSVAIKYSWRDDVNKKVFVYSSTPVSVATGRGSWNCN
jgi:hypothetical protein